MSKGFGFETIALHVGQEPDPCTGAVVAPLYQASTFVQDAVGQTRAGYDYSRTANPTRDALQRCLAALEGGESALAFPTGLSAVDTLIRTVCHPGDHVIVPRGVYSGTYRLFTKVAAACGLQHTIADFSDEDDVRNAIGPHTRLIWLETPTNPHLDIADIALFSRIAHEHGALLAVDNTLASPYLQQPLALGADVVVHSTTKYLAGHADALGGALVLNDEELTERLTFLQNAVGAAPAPFDSWLTLRGMKTLALRLDRQCDNAERIVGFLSTHPSVRQVLYPGLPDHPGHGTAVTQMRRFGAMVGFRVAGGESAAINVCNRTRVILLAVSLGGVQSLIEHPATESRAVCPEAPITVPEDLVRLSVGVETVDDIIDDLRYALG